MNRYYDGYFEGRRILITGGASGIGRATALKFALAGALVAVADIDIAGGQSLQAEISASGGTARFFHADACDEASIASVIAGITVAFGPVQHAFNNVGATVPGSLESMTRSEWDKTLEITLTSTFLAMKHEIVVMKANGGGTIVNTASIAGKIFSGSSPAYAAAKAAVIHLSRCAACVYGVDNIRVNSVSPGMVATPLIERLFSSEQQAALVRRLQSINRVISADDVAAAVLYLCSGDASMVTGTDVEVSGGRQS